MRTTSVTLVIEADPSAVLDAMERLLDGCGFRPAERLEVIAGSSLILRLEPYARGLAIRLDCSFLDDGEPSPCSKVGRYLADRFARVDVYIDFSDGSGLFQHFVGGELVLELDGEPKGELRGACRGVPWEVLLAPAPPIGPDHVRDTAVRELGPASFWALQAHKPPSHVVNLAMVYRLGEKTGTSSFANAYHRV